MGKCASKLSNCPPPNDITEFEGNEIRQIIKDTLQPKQINIADSMYGCYPKSEVERFLSSDTVDKLKYHKERFDCDNFALALAGREAEWYAAGAYASGSSFGIVHGDIRKKESDTTPRPHAINFFIDNEGELWLIEPQTDEIFKPTASSTFWMTLC
jgi:hypothetical protein